MTCSSRVTVGVRVSVRKAFRTATENRAPAAPRRRRAAPRRSPPLQPAPAPAPQAAPRSAPSAGRRGRRRPLADTVGRPRRAARRRADAGQAQRTCPTSLRRRSRRRPTDSRHSEAYYETKSTIFGALIEAIDLAQLAKLDAESAREEIRDIVNEIIAIKNVVMSISEQEELLDDICNDVLGYGPLEPLLARDDIADIMVNGSGTTYIEVKGKIQKTGIRFRDNQQLLNICQRIVSQIGRRVDESSPICDARLPDGSRVNVIVPPLAIDGPALTIRKFKKDKLTLEQLVRFGTHHAGRRRHPQGHRPLPRQHPRVRRHRLRQDHAAQLPHPVHRRRRAHHHLRGRGRIATPAAAHRAAGNPPAQPRRRRPGHHARPGQELPAHAAGTDHRRRGARTRGVRPAAGDEHRPRRLDGHAARQHPARGAVARRIHDHHGRLLAALAHHPRNDRAARSTSSCRPRACATARAASPTSPRWSAWKATSSSPRTFSSTT